MTQEELTEVLLDVLEPVLSQQQNIKEVLVVLVVSVGILAGVFLASTLWRKL